MQSRSEILIWSCREKSYRNLLQRGKTLWHRTIKITDFISILSIKAILNPFILSHSFPRMAAPMDVDSCQMWQLTSTIFVIFWQMKIDTWWQMMFNWWRLTADGFDAICGLSVFVWDFEKWKFWNVCRRKRWETILWNFFLTFSIFSTVALSLLNFVF